MTSCTYSLHTPESHARSVARKLSPFILDEGEQGLFVEKLLEIKHGNAPYNPENDVKLALKNMYKKTT